MKNIWVQKVFSPLDTCIEFVCHSLSSTAILWWKSFSHSKLWNSTRWIFINKTFHLFYFKKKSCWCFWNALRSLFISVFLLCLRRSFLFISMHCHMRKNIKFLSKFPKRSRSFKTVFLKQHKLKIAHSSLLMYRMTIVRHSFLFLKVTTHPFWHWKWHLITKSSLARQK